MTATGPVKPSTPRGLESNAFEAVKHLALEDEARALLGPKLTIREYVDALVAVELFSDAVTVLALALPKREAVWWACLCVRSGTTEKEPAPRGSALEAAERWVMDPSDANRRAAGEAAEAEDHGTPGSLAALGAFFSGGSLVPENVKAVVPPPEEGTTQAAATAVILAAVGGDPEKIEDNYRTSVKLGYDVARGRQAWCRPQAGGGPSHAEGRETWAFPRQG